MTMQSADAGENLVVARNYTGLGSFTVPTLLTRLNYFDGQFIRAERLELEQQYFRALVALSNRAGGAGIVHGLNVDKVGDGQLRVSPGLAIDGRGRLLLLAKSHTIEFDEVLALSQRRLNRFEGLEQSTSGALFGSARLYLLSAIYAERPAGVGDTTTVAEGIAVRAVPLVLRIPLATSRSVVLQPGRHLRSLVASAFFAGELAAAGSLISGRGLMRPAWCFGARRDTPVSVPLALVARAGGRTLFIDQWIVRRERIEAAPKRYWAGLMRMRPWDVFLAQVLQFQCQLNAAIGVAPTEEGEDPCAESAIVLADVAQYLVRVEQLYRKLPFFNLPAEVTAPKQRPDLARSASAKILSSMKTGPSVGLAEQVGPLASIDKLESFFVEDAAVPQSSPTSVAASSLTSFILPGGATGLSVLKGQLLRTLLEILQRPNHGLLIDRGIVELPPAGYLPVGVGSEQTVNDQVRNLLGKGLDLCFCVVRADTVAHAFAEAQHLDRISLLKGLDDPRRRPQVDILVPDGKRLTPPPPDGLYEAKLRIAEVQAGTGSFSGVARAAARKNGGHDFHLATFGSASKLLDRLLAILQTKSLSAGQWPIVGALEDGDSAGDPTGSFPFLFQAMGFRVAGVPVVADHALWFDLSCHDDLRTLPPFESTGVSGRIVLARSGSATQALEMVIGGKVTVLTNETSGGGSKISTALSLTLTPFAHGVDTAAAKILAEARQLYMRLDYTGDTAHGALAGTVFDARMRRDPILRWRVSWGDANGAVSTVVASGASDAAGAFKLRPLVELRLTANAAVLQPAHSLHILADSALRLVQEALLSEGSFRRIAEKQLFGVSVPEEVPIEARRGWVLFHRRRPSRCVTIRSAPVPRRSYRIFMLAVAGEADLREVLAQLESDDEQVQSALRDRIVTGEGAAKLIVEFDGSRLRTTEGAIEEAWSKFETGAHLDCVVITSDGDDGHGIQIDRAKRLAEVLGEAALVDDGTQFVASPERPLALSSFDAEGTILVLPRAVVG
jgi:hypothetical protein